jgi:D-proline reductase (dithiol) PrdB
VSLIARGLEARSLPTLSMSTLYELSQGFKPPRTVFLDFPLGCTAGKPNEPDLQRRILRDALCAAPKFGEPWSIVELPYQFSPNGNRDWEEIVKDMYRKGDGAKTISAHSDDHTKGEGDLLLGREKEFSIRCNC